MKYLCSVYDAAGSLKHERVDAVGPDEALDALRRRGLFPVDAKPDAGDDADAAGGAGADPRTPRRGRPGRQRRILDMTRQMSVLVGTGTPVADVLQSLERQARPGPWHDAIADIRRRVESGETLSRAMEVHSDWFDPVCTSLIAAGEAGGRLDAVLDRLHDVTRQHIKITGAVRGAMAYPCVLIVLAISVLTGMVGFVLPRFEGLFKTLDTALPPTTRLVMAVSHFAQEDWPWIVGVAVSLIVGVIAYARTASGGTAADYLMVQLPGLRTVARGLIAARIARILGVLLDGRVPLLDALALTRAAAGNELYRVHLSRAAEAVTRGEPLADALAPGGLMGVTLCEGVRSGERSGQVARVLLSIADAMDEENEVLVKALTSLLEPVILAVLGVIVGIVAIGMFLPLFDLTAAGSGGGGGGGAP